MNCNGIVIHFILIFMSLIITINIEIVVTSQHPKKLQERQQNKNHPLFLLDEGTNGDLYDLFQKRLQAVQTELSYHSLTDLDQETAKVKEKSYYLDKNSNNRNYKRFSMQKELYEDYKKKMNTINKGLSRDGETFFDRKERSFFDWLKSVTKDTKLKEQKYEYLNNENTSKISNKEGKNAQFPEENENFREEEILYQNPSHLYANKTGEKLYQEFQKQLKLIKSVISSEEKHDYRWMSPYLNKDQNDENWLQDGDNYDHLQWDYENPYEYEIWNQLPQKATYSNLHRRQAIPNTTNNNTSLYPSVLTEAVEISLNPTVHANSGGSLLANVAQKMNTSTLDLAEKLAKSTDNLQNNGQFTQMVHNFMTNNGGIISANTSKPVAAQIIPAEIETTNDRRPIIVQKDPVSSMGSTEVLQEYIENEESPNKITTSSLTAILDRVLSKLDSIHDERNKNEEEHPDGIPCDITGSWSSITLGLCFDIQLNKNKVRDVSPAEVNNKILSIKAQDCIPPKSHQIIDLEWKFGGSAFKQLGGPFYIYTQKRSESLVGTFLGYCRTCAGIDTIFGSWTFLSPSKDCRDISLSFNVKRDLLHRGRMEIKRKERFKDLLYQSRIGKT